MHDEGAQPGTTQSLALRDIPTEVVYRLKMRQMELSRDAGRTIPISEIGEAALRQWLATGGHLSTDAAESIR